ncbi:uncharacterized protein LOC111802504 isoform X1 [Cucurbita pepo subsp. pepo]|uniref:uncharacterized protein LOC111802504 isoform X1 n=1 Tax=Cucurbita pepo subsp. pepo TaxID=3664 RepID=UPI000C9D7E70|nr:uncharacterized protein LOC111802504 isoform X1 [Cucurbita pepo subsp. pepo]
MGAEAIQKQWDTWEELLLGGAILRHGTTDWNLVAAELRARIVRPCAYTPEVCKAKYEDLQKRFVGCKAWYEELRRQRIMELRRALEHSEDSIGSLESKLEALKSRSGDKSLVNSSDRSESWGVVHKPTNELSAGSFTQENRTCSSVECRSAPFLADETEIKPEASQLRCLKWGKVGTGKKRSRGKRKRKDCSSRDVKEGSTGENNLSESANPSTVSHSKDNSCCNSFEPRESSDANEASRSSTMDGVDVDVLMAAFNAVAENKSASVFRRRLDSQKRGRYKKLIRQHLDIETIRSRVASHYITTQKELYRDLLLLANNALVFYLPNTREYRSAVLLRRLITSTFQKLFKNSHDKRTQTRDQVAKPHRLQPAKRNESRKEVNPGDAKTPSGNRRRSNANSHSSVGLAKTETSASTVKREPRGTRKSVVGTLKSERSAATVARGRKRGRTK